MSKLDKYTAFDHSPARPVRDGLSGELVFANAWKKLMSTPATDSDVPPLVKVLENFRPHIEAQDARVLASVVTWFGTHMGKVFLDSVQEADGQDRFLCAWGAQNKSVPWVNSGRRTLERVMYGDGPGKMTIRQHEAAECLMSWLGKSPEALSFMADCESQLLQLGREDTLTHYLSANCHLRPDQVAYALKLAKALPEQGMPY